jgi:high-affinity nickel-transport protein
MSVDGIELGLAVTTLGFGLRHGIDWDHLAAIADVTSTQATPRRALRMATLYALGHGVVVFGLGLLAVVFGDVLPAWVDGAMERLVGASLIVLAVVVVVSLARDRGEVRLRSRWMLLADGLRWTRARFVEVVHDHAHDERHGHEHEVVGGSAPTVAGQASARVATVVRHRHVHRHVGPEPADPFRATGARAAVLLGVVHGIGAETPTQVVLFLTAANVAGTGVAVLLLGLFVLGILVSNTAIACVTTFGSRRAGRTSRAYAGLAVVNAACSLGIGLLFLLGRSAVLPPILGG